jgi:acyl carrier protein phosphodiesterase
VISQLCIFHVQQVVDWWFCMTQPWKCFNPNLSLNNFVRRSYLSKKKCPGNLPSIVVQPVTHQLNNKDKFFRKIDIMVI